jgi:hypothetical protein
MQALTENRKADMMQKMEEYRWQIVVETAAPAPAVAGSWC